MLICLTFNIEGIVWTSQQICLFTLGQGTTWDGSTLHF